MNIKQLRYVMAILATGSFSAAAAREGVSVQAVSKSMSELEGEVGEPLFERASSGVNPTQLGRAFGVRARHVLREYDELERFVRSRGHDADPTAPFRIGFCCPEFPGIERLCALIETLTGRALRRKVDVALVTGRSCVADLRERRIDALITIGQLRERGIVCGSLGTMMSCVVMSPKNPLASKPAVTLGDINGCPVALSCDFDHFNESVCQAYVARGMTSELVEISHQEDFVEFLEERGGLSFIVGGEFMGFLGDMVMRPIDPADRVMVPICLSSLSGADVSYLEIRHALSEMKLFS